MRNFPVWFLCYIRNFRYLCCIQNLRYLCPYSILSISLLYIQTLLINLFYTTRNIRHLCYIYIDISAKGFISVICENFDIFSVCETFDICYASTFDFSVICETFGIFAIFATFDSSAICATFGIFPICETFDISAICINFDICYMRKFEYICNIYL